MIDDIIDILNKKGETSDETAFISVDELQKYIDDKCMRAFALGVEYREDEPPPLPEYELTGRYFESISIQRRFRFFALPKLVNK